MYASILGYETVRVFVWRNINNDGQGTRATRSSTESWTILSSPTFSTPIPLPPTLLNIFNLLSSNLILPIFYLGENTSKSVR
jgi:hypothetical protein